MTSTGMPALPCATSSAPPTTPSSSSDGAAHKARGDTLDPTSCSGTTATPPASPEQVLALNPGLAELGPILPTGTLSQCQRPHPGRAAADPAMGLTMSRLDDELERLANISEQQIAARVHAARISGTGPHYCIDCDNTIPQRAVKRSEAANAAPSARPSTNFKTARHYGGKR